MHTFVLCAIFSLFSFFAFRLVLRALIVFALGRSVASCCRVVPFGREHCAIGVASELACCYGELYISRVSNGRELGRKSSQVELRRLAVTGDHGGLAERESAVRYYSQYSE
ncbi:hypothetical protein PanWU01x14_108330 [Parasponia andersonii]|uniref:Uncharacterized protein n=1 Tax=Parasponia andersonii TaxID=3476 RepID=A0A2P5CZX9_PARAD|nr:hypothetical protein PanWU01x14_108330 [Parasponia andersonii]